MMAAAHGSAGLGSEVAAKRLPASTTRYFDRDPETNEVLWFAAPPLDIARPTGPEYSLEYLAFLARKHKDAKMGSSPGEGGSR